MDLVIAESLTSDPNWMRTVIASIITSPTRQRVRIGRVNSLARQACIESAVPSLQLQILAGKPVNLLTVFFGVNAV